MAVDRVDEQRLAPRGMLQGRSCRLPMRLDPSTQDIQFQVRQAQRILPQPQAVHLLTWPEADRCHLKAIAYLVMVKVVVRILLAVEARSEAAMTESGLT